LICFNNIMQINKMYYVCTPLETKKCLILVSPIVLNFD